MNPSPSTAIRLTQTVKKGGCAAKISANDLRRILSALRFPTPHPELLIDGRNFDDAAIYQVSDDLALVQTVDFFTPVVDSPGCFGRIAAANALSDVYAMGGRPKTCLAILAFPLATLPTELASEILQNAADVISESGANLVGGHSIDDDALKFGLSVTGYVHPKKVWSNSGAKTGDILILSKGLGTGTLTAALKQGAVSENDIQEALSSMMMLNNLIEDLSPELIGSIHAATDVTGFGFAGHAYNLAKASGVQLEVKAGQLPILEGAQECLKREFFTKAHRTNREYVRSYLKTSGLESWQEALLFDPQTSGGLLLAVDPGFAERLLTASQRRFPLSQIVGSVAAPTVPQEFGISVYA